MYDESFGALLQSLDSEPSCRGHQFERLCKWYLLNDPIYRRQLRRVWLWNEWPGRWGPDAGIDLIAEQHDGQLWAIQAKAYQPTYSIKKADVDSFLSESARSEIVYRLLIATTDLIGVNSARAIRAQEKPAGLILLSDLKRAGVVWPASIQELGPSPPTRNTPRPHQTEAIDAILQGFSRSDRGQLIMACGTGKTLVSLWVREALQAERTLVLVPSLSLLKQTIREWLLNAKGEFEYTPVCSDDTVRSRDQVAAHVSDLGYPATGSPEQVSDFLRRAGPRVVFATYQSSLVVAAATQQSDVVFDLVLADEAHRCAGAASSDFATVLDAGRIRAKRRLFMTATPRFFTGRIQKIGVEADFEIASMDDENRFGGVFHRLSFAEAIDRDLLSNYRLLVIGVNDETYRQYAESGHFVSRDGEVVTDARSLAAQIGVAKAMRRYDLQRLITFHSRVKLAREFADSFPEVAAWMPETDRPKGTIKADHVSGMMNSGQRESRLDVLRHLSGAERCVLANARCLSEGVDIPALDGIAFIDPKRSEVDIAQAVGRAIRKDEKKAIGTIVIPVFVGSGEGAEVVLDKSEFKPVWDVIRALRDHDESLGEELDDLRRTQGRLQTAHIPQKIIIDMPAAIDDKFVEAFETQLVEQTSSMWEFWFGLLQSFVDREGHARVPAKFGERGYLLGQWVGKQRSAKRAARLSPREEGRLEELSGWTWEPFTESWEEACRHLQRFLEREGHAHVPAAHMESGFGLGSWVANQRTLYRNGTLDGQRIERLEALHSWIWDANTLAWENGFKNLARFLKREGHAQVPFGHIEDGYTLHTWVNSQRERYRKNVLDPERLQRLEAVDGWSWGVNSDAWEEGYTHLTSFVERENHAQVTVDHVENGYRLGQWAATQRKLHRRGQLVEQRAERLHDLPGWNWDPVTRAWERGFGCLLSFARREGHCRMPSGHVEDGFELHVWVVRQRGIHRRGKLGVERVQLLESLPGWTWDPFRDAWDEGYAQLMRFVEREGHARVDGRHMENGYALGKWTTMQRVLKRQGDLGPQRVLRLEAVPDWSWSPFDEVWEKRYAQLVQYVEREGNGLVPVGYVEDGHFVGRWVAVQRVNYRKRALGPIRVQRLEALAGWSWDPKQDAWDEGFRQLSKFTEREGHARVPQRHIERGYNLGQWVASQRKAYLKGRIDEELKQRLEQRPGWEWRVTTGRES
jgi:superfamily II DNA or RNA helicase